MFQSPWHVGIDAGFDEDTANLDFCDTDLDLSLATEWKGDGLLDPLTVDK